MLTEYARLPYYVFCIFFAQMSDEESLITEYFNHSYSYLEILVFLLLHHSIVISYRTFKRRLQKLGLTLYFPMFTFDPPENIRKPLVFRGIKREHWEVKG